MASPQKAAVVPNFDIHDRCRKAREACDLTQRELAERVGLSVRTVSRYESRASKNLHPIFLERWAEACRVPVEWLRYGETSKQRLLRERSQRPPKAKADEPGHTTGEYRKRAAA